MNAINSLVSEEFIDILSETDQPYDEIAVVGFYPQRKDLESCLSGSQSERKSNNTPHS